MITRLKIWITMVVCVWCGITQAASILDTSFAPVPGVTGGIVESVLQQPDQKILICGNFTNVNGVAQAYIARLNLNGSVDTSFKASPSYWVRHMALQPDGKIVIGGYFTSVAGVSRGLIARLNADGSLDTTFNPGRGAETIIAAGVDGSMDPFVFALLVQPDGKILFGGNFRTYNGQSSVGIARANADGSLDSTFKVGSGVDNWVRSLQMLPNGQILVTGWITSYNNQSFNRMVKLNLDGTADVTFKPFFGDKTSIYTAVQQPDGKIIAAGHSINDQGLFLQKIARLNTNGTFDTSFTASSNDKIESMVLLADGSVIIGGYFSQINGVARSGIARLSATGALDASYAANIDSFVWTVALQSDATVLISGGFNKIDGATRQGVARLNKPGVLLNPVPIRQKHDASGLTILWMTVAGQTYAVQSRSSLSPLDWTNVTTVTGNGQEQQYKQTFATDSKFLRVVTY